MNFPDPRMDPHRFYMMPQYHNPYPPPPPPNQPKQGQDEEIAMNLLKLNKNTAESSPGPAGSDPQQQQHQPGVGGRPTDEELYRNSMHAQQQQQRHHHHQAAAFMHGAPYGGGMYPPMGSVYGYPAMGFDRQMLAASVGRERAPPQHHAPPMAMDEPPIVLTDVSFSDLIGDSTLVSLKDRDLIPEALFVSLAQLKPCKLQQADRVGCYKTREIGFVGMCCKHCGGQPGYGRYFPNSVRSLAQTTTSQTILKHIGGKCRFCPPTIRKAVLELQRQQAQREGLATSRPRYGSRKIFFQRMWARLHSKDPGDLDIDGEIKSDEGNADGEADTEFDAPRAVKEEEDAKDRGSARATDSEAKIEAPEASAEDGDGEKAEVVAI